VNKYVTVGGILSIVSGSMGILSGLALIVVAFLAAWAIGLDPSLYGSGDMYFKEMSTVVGLIYGIMGGVLILLGVLALIGGIFSVRKKVWGLALAGAIASIMVFFPVGVVAVVFTAMAKPEFNGQTPPAPIVVSPPPPQQ
jgi:hypothetical protein